MPKLIYLAAVFGEMKQYAKAEPLLRQAGELYKKDPGPDSPSYLGSCPLLRDI
jgi:hypothetical protein